MQPHASVSLSLLLVSLASAPAQRKEDQNKTIIFVADRVPAEQEGEEEGGGLVVATLLLHTSCCLNICAGRTGKFGSGPLQQLDPPQ